MAQAKIDSYTFVKSNWQENEKQRKKKNVKAKRDDQKKKIKIIN